MYTNISNDTNIPGSTARGGAGKVSKRWQYDMESTEHADMLKIEVVSDIPVLFKHFVAMIRTMC